MEVRVHPRGSACLALCSPTKIFSQGADKCLLSLPRPVQRKISIRKATSLACAILLLFTSVAALGQCGDFILADLPKVARAKISGVLGHDMPAYGAQSQGASFFVPNQQQQLDATFTPEGVAVRDGEGVFRLTLQAYGYEGSLRPEGRVTPKASFNRVEYRRGWLTEWYKNGPAGLEQGFTVSRPPLQRNGQPLTIALALSGDFAAELGDGGRSLTLKSRKDGRDVNYAGLSATDATGKELHAWIELKSSNLLLKVEDSGARYPVVIDPWFQLAKVSTVPGDAFLFGVSAAISGDVLVVGAPITDSFGSVFVFVKPKNGWAHLTQTAKLTPTGTDPNDDVGISVSISGDTVVAGSSQDLDGGKGSGAAYVFVKPPGGWKDTTNIVKLTTDDPGATFGASVAVEGDTIVVGQPDTYPYTTPGAAYVFVKPANGWKHATQTAKLTASDGQTGDELGCSAAISGRTIVSAAPGNGTDNGKAYIFVEPTRGWTNMTQAAELTASDGGPSEFFGAAAVIRGGTVIVGAPYKSMHGAAYVFTRPASGWRNATESARLTSSDPGTTWFGYSLALDGRKAIVGDPHYSRRQNTREGAAFVYNKPKDGWKTTSQFSDKLTGSDAKLVTFFGTSVAVAPSAVMVGAAWAGFGFNPYGAMYIFAEP